MDLRLTVRTTVALMLALFMTNGHADIKRTAAGHPDLTGTYNVATLTPLQRPKRYGDKLTITPEEAQPTWCRASLTFQGDDPRVVIHFVNNHHVIIGLHHAFEVVVHHRQRWRSRSGSETEYAAFCQGS